MLFRYLTLFCSLALTAQSILLPPSIPSDAEGVSDVVDSNNRLVRLNCPGCLFAESDGAGKVYHWDDGVENALFLNFSIDAASPEALTLNGVQLFPLQIVPPSLTALQIPSTVSLMALNIVTAAYWDTGIMPFARLRLGYQLSIHPIRPMSEGNDFEVLSVSFRVLGIEGKPVMGLDTVEMTLLKSPDNLLYIASLDKTQASHDPFSINPIAQVGASEEECKVFPLLCKLKTIVGDKLSGVKASLKKGCHKSRPGHAKGDKSKGEHFKGHPVGKPERPHHHGHHRGHGLRKLLYRLKRVAAHIIVPVFIGIAAGMAATLLGMGVGFLAIVLWRKFYRGGNRAGYSMVLQSEDYSEDHSRENELLDDKGLPEYEDVVVISREDEGDVKDKE
ncbi:MAG: hypothetical protein M1839_006634 [Geoglossum umbratile]|nr:MAG: hypothetical protein M1839_006634 [Geoglossum umbratile]